MSASQKKLQPTLSMKDFDPEQLAAVEHACARPWSLQVLPTGFGKSIISLTAARQQLQTGKVTRVLVIAPLKVCKLTWATEHLKWDHLKDLDVALAIGSPAKRVAAIMSCAEIVVLNVQGLSLRLRLNRIKAGLTIIMNNLIEIIDVCAVSICAP